MGSLIVLSLLIVATFVVLCYIFNESRIELSSPTIAAMEAHAETLDARREAERQAEREPTVVQERYYSEDSAGTAESEADTADFPSMPPMTDYEYRELLKEGGENYVLPQWIVNFFSSSDICHTLDPNDNVVFIAKLRDAGNARGDIMDFAAESDMSTQTIALNVCFGEGASEETLKTKFYLFERGDLFELNRLVRQDEVRIDILTRGEDYTLEYACTFHARLPQDTLSQLKNVLAKIPS